VITTKANQYIYKPKVRTLLQCVEFGVSFGTILGAFVLLGKARKIDADGIIDRGTRIYNREPAKFDMDTAFLIGGSVTAIAFLADAFQEFVAETRLERFTRGFAFGGALGFASKGGLQVVWKLINKTLVME